MANLNKVFLIGNLTRDPELRYTPNGVAVCEFGIAVNRSWTSKDGQKRDETCFVDCQAWARSGELISEYCKKGRPLFIEGRLTFDSWEGRDGQKRSRLRVTVENFQFLGGGGGRRDGTPGSERGKAPTEKADGPAPPEAAAEAPYQVDDDIPF